MFLLAPVVPGDSATGFCHETAVLWQFVGIVLLVVKIVIPVILIILGMVDLGKAVIASKDDAISKSAKQLLMRLIAAVVIFFIPTIVSAIFFLIGSFNNDVRADYEVCRECIEHPRRGDANQPGTCGYYAG